MPHIYVGPVVMVYPRERTAPGDTYNSTIRQHLAFPAAPKLAETAATPLESLPSLILSYALADMSVKTAVRLEQQVFAYGFRCRGGYTKCADVRDGTIREAATTAGPAPASATHDE